MLSQTVSIFYYGKMFPLKTGLAKAHIYIKCLEENAVRIPPQTLIQYMFYFKTNWSIQIMLCSERQGSSALIPHYGHQSPILLAGCLHTPARGTVHAVRKNCLSRGKELFFNSIQFQKTHFILTTGIRQHTHVQNF